MQSRLLAAVGWTARRWQQPVAFCARHRRPLSSASGAASDLSLRISDLYTRLMEVDWVDRNEDNDLMYEQAEEAVVEFRKVYSIAGSNTGEMNDLYEKARKLHIAKEVAKLCDNYGELFTIMNRESNDATGFLGDNTRDLSSEEELKVVRALREYIDFMKSIKDKEIAAKAKKQLGQKALLLRQVISAECFSSTVAPIAGDHLMI